MESSKTKKKISSASHDTFAGTRMRWELLWFNMGPLFTVEFFYTLITSMIVSPMLAFYIQTVMSTAGVENLTGRNLEVLLTNPLLIVGALLLLLIVGLCSLLDIGVAIYVFDCSRQKKRTTVRSAIAFSLKNAGRALKPNNLPIILVCLVLVPFVGLGMNTSILSSISVPQELFTRLYSNLATVVCIVIGTLILLILSLRWMYAVHYFAIEQLSFREAVHRSSSLKRTKRLQNLLSMVIIQVALVLISKIVLVAGSAIVSSCLQNFGAETFPCALLASVLFIAFAGFYLFIILLSMPIGVLKISGKLYQLQSVAEETPVDLDSGPAPSKRIRKIVNIILCALLTAFILIQAEYATMVANGELEASMLKTSPVTICAYLGDTSDNAANSLGALEAAAQDEADAAYIKVQISRDGIVFLGTSQELSTVCGLLGECQNYDFATISECPLTIPTSLNTLLNHKDEYPSRLTDAIALAQTSNLTLLIDISDLTYYPGGIDLVVDQVAQANAYSICEIASNTYADLKEVRKYSAETKTVYLAGIASDNYEDLTAADAITLENELMTEDNVKAIHSYGYLAYVWFATDTSGLASSLKNGADAVITSDVKTAVKLVDHHGLNDILYAYYSKLGS